MDKLLFFQKAIRGSRGGGGLLANFFKYDCADCPSQNRPCSRPYKSKNYTLFCTNLEKIYPVQDTECKGKPKRKQRLKVTERTYENTWWAENLEMYMYMLHVEFIGLLQIYCVYERFEIIDVYYQNVTLFLTNGWNLWPCSRQQDLKNWTLYCGTLTPLKI